jgi:hypothetical protein
VLLCSGFKESDETSPSWHDHVHDFCDPLAIPQTRKSDHISKDAADSKSIAQSIEPVTTKVDLAQKLPTAHVTGISAYPMMADSRRKVCRPWVQ